MHYKDGTEAKMGDLVSGKGYNAPHEVQGVVSRLIPADSCNISLWCYASWPVGGPVVPFEEHGEAKEFQLVYRPPVEGVPK